VFEQTVGRIQVDLLRHLDNLVVFCSEYEALVRIQNIRKWERRRRLGKRLGNHVLLIIRMRKSLNNALPGAYRGAYVIRGRRPKGTGLVQRKPSARYHVLMVGIESNKQRLENGRHTVSVFVMVLGKEWVRSHQGDMSTPPAGAGRPESRMTWRSASDKPPPAESPAITIRSGLTGRCAAPSGGLIRKISRLVFNFTSDNARNHSHAARRSWMAQGKGY
jgi:hypothetical protein